MKTLEMSSAEDDLFAVDTHYDASTIFSDEPSLTRSITLSGNTNVQPFKREPGSDAITVEWMWSDLGWQSRVRDREKKPRCQYKHCENDIRDAPYVVNRTLDKFAKRAKKLNNISVDELDGDSGVDEISITSSCSIDSMKVPPHMSPAGTSDSGSLSSKTPEMCGAGDTHDASIINPHEPSDESHTQARGSRPSPSRFSGVCSAGDNGFKDPQSGGSTSGSYSDPNTFEPPNLVLPRSLGVRSFHSTTSSHGNSGGEELERPSPGRTRRDPGSSPLPYNTNVPPFKREAGSDDVTVERMRSDLGWQSSVTQQYPIQPGIPDIKGSEKFGVTNRGWKSKAKKRAKKILTYNKRSSGKRRTIGPVPEGSISEKCCSSYSTGTNVNQGFNVPISRPTSMGPLPKQSSHRQIPATPPPTSLNRTAVRLDQGINVPYEMQSPIRPGCSTNSLESVSEFPIIQKVHPACCRSLYKF